ncbi:alpha/beta hydrolase [Teichococcus oryzae]|uniref:Alpha/beta hydrolase n=1 Tax=Teichococcus oryzae TaxID=1608942 RepID=A0A5B2TDW7_9PROT|nr:alpha/beta hydrolase [Pseudoroseomonas oryzae]KAA2212682.1 alpha/beta hydrolase [Pseudoroseomonas oryzae]
MTTISRRASLMLPFGLAGLVAACAAPPEPQMPADPTGRADPEMRALLESLQALRPQPIETLSPAEARLQPGMTEAVRHRLRALGRSDAPRPLPVVRDLEIPGRGGPLAARLYSPAEPPRAGQPPRAPLPLIVYFHGGGFVIANLDTYDASARALAAESEAIVLSVHYRQAPENKFPAAHEDAYAAYMWALGNAASLGADLTRVAVVGESAGGNLAINVAMAAREARAPLPVAMGLIYPVAGTDMTTPSYLANADAKPLNAAMMKWFFGHYAASPSDAQDTRLNVYGRAELRGLPKAIIVTAEIDPLHDDGTRLASRLQESGVQVVAKDFAGVTHEFFGADPFVLAKAGDAQRFVAGELRSAFALPAPAVVVPARRVTPRG